jgi:hypothetical protein
MKSTPAASSEALLQIELGVLAKYIPISKFRSIRVLTPIGLRSILVGSKN